MKTAILLLTWKRIENLKATLRSLSVQTNKNFDVFVSNGNLDPKAMASVEKYVQNFSNLNIYLSHDGNSEFTFRRFTKGRELAKAGYDVIMYIDDDVSITQHYVAKCLEQYEPKTYKSGFCWIFFNRGKNYYKFRKRVFSNDFNIHYAGTGISMIDASIFLQKKLFNAPEGSEKIEDLWLSYFVDNLNGWRLAYMDVGEVTIRGVDSVALFRQVGDSPMNKAVFLRKLVEMGWKLPATLPDELAE
jgi:hypothetical protein